MIDDRAPSAPASVQWLAIGIVGGVMVIYFEACHEIARALIGGFGSPGTAVCSAVVATSIGALPLVALIPLTRLPNWWWSEGLPYARVQRGECPDCGYPAERYPCPECGGDGNLALQPLVIGLEVGRALRLVAIALALGIVLAEWRIRNDESDFVTETQAVGTVFARKHERPRAGWGGFAHLIHEPDAGFSAPPPYTTTLIPGLKQHERPVRSPR
jgi:hypothetical protein